MIKCLRSIKNIIRYNSNKVDSTCRIEVHRIGRVHVRSDHIENVNDDSLEMIGNHYDYN